MLLAPAAIAGVLDGDSTPAERARHTGATVYSSLRYFTGNDWTARDDIEGNWSRRYEPRNGRNLAVDILRAEVGMAYDAWRVGYVHRQEAIIEASRDTLDLLYYQKNNLPIPAGRRFGVDFDAGSIEAEGIRVERAFELHRSERVGLWAGLGVSWLRGIRTRAGTVRGTVAATAPNAFSFDAQLNESNTKKTFPFLAPGSPEGSGYALDVALELMWADRNRLLLSIDDIDSRIAWRDVPTTQARATSNTATRDAQGFIIYQPTLSGQNRRSDYIQHLDPKTYLHYSRDFGALAAGVGVFAVRGITMPRVTLDYRFDAAWRVGVEHDFRFGSVGVGLRYRSLAVSVLSERADVRSAKAYGLSAQLAVPF